MKRLYELTVETVHWEYLKFDLKYLDTELDESSFSSQQPSRTYSYNHLGSNYIYSCVGYNHKLTVF
jgi:hypothetical protein